MLHSRANALVSVRRVTEQNAGRMTAGVDGAVVVTAPGKAFLAYSVQKQPGSFAPKPFKVKSQGVVYESSEPLVRPG
jgi:RNA-directed DNA polymerase